MTSTDNIEFMVLSDCEISYHILYDIDTRWDPKSRENSKFNVCPKVQTMEMRKVNYQKIQNIWIPYA